MARMQEFWRSHKDEIGLIVGALVAVVSESLRHLTDFLTRTLAMLGRAWKKWGDEILAVGRFSFSTLVSVVEAALDLLAGTIKVAMAAIEGDWSEAWDLITGGVRDAFYKMNNFLKKWGGKLVNYMGELIGDIIQWWADLAQELIGGSIVPDMLADIISAFTSWNLVSTIEGILQSTFEKFDTLRKDAVGAVKTLKNKAVGQIVKLGNRMISRANELKNKVKGKFNKLKEEALGKISTLKSKTVGKIDSLIGDAKSKANSVKNKVKGKFDTLKEKAVGKMEDLVSGVLSAVSPQNLKNKLKSKIGDALGAAKEKFQSLANDVTGNSIVPDMVADIEAVMAGMDMASPAERELAGVLSAADDHAAAMLSTLDRDYGGAMSMAGALGDAIPAGTAELGAQGGSSRNGERSGDTHNNIRIRVRVDGRGTREDGEAVGQGLLDEFRAHGIETF